MGSVGEDEGSRDVVFNLSKRLKNDSEGTDSGSKRLRISEPVHQGFGVSEEIETEKKATIENEVMGSGEEIDLNVKLVSCSDELNSCYDGAMDFDLNVGLWGTENDGFVPVAAERRVEIIDIASDESEDDDVKIVDAKDVNGRSKQIEKENADEYMKNFDLGWGLKERSFGSSSSVSGERRYTREEKGKAKVSDSWLSLGLNGEHRPIVRDLALRIEEQEQRIEEFDAQLEEDDDEKAFDFLNVEEQNDDELAGYHGDSYYRRRALEFREHDRRQTARRFARSEGYSEASNKEKAPFEDEELLGKSPGSFSTALKLVRERNTRSPEQSLETLSQNKGCNGSRRLVPSLLDLSLGTLSQNADAIVSLELVPDILRQRLTDLLCNLRKMNVLALDLLVKGSPTEIRVKDSSWLTEEYFFKTFGNFDAKNLMVLQLDLCGQCNLDYLMSKTFAQFFNSLPRLCIISVKGACRLSDNGLKALVTSAPSLQSINLSQCSLLTHVGINILATSLGSILKELYIDECLKIDAMLALPALKKFEHLEVLSVAGIQTVSDQFVRDLMATCGQTIKELDLANCQALTNYSLRFVGDASTNLHSLNISNLEKLTDLGLQFLADGCRSIETLKLSRSNFSDEAIAAFLEASGESLKDLSLNNITLVGPCTAFSLAKCSRKLSSLDLSWCRKITNKALGLIVDNCLSLKLVKLFGCTQITDIFLNGHPNPRVQVVGLKLTPILETTDMLKPLGVLLRYSPLAPLPESQ